MEWKKIILWVPAVFAGLAIGLATVTALLVKISPRIRKQILVKVEHYIAESSGMQVAIRDFKLDLSRFGIEFFEIVVQRREAESGPPLVQIERAAIDIKLSSAFQRRLHFRNLIIHRPVVHVLTDRFSGTNLPPPKISLSGGIAAMLNLAIQKCVIDGGEIYFNDAKSQLEAEIYNLNSRVQFDRTKDRYHAVLSYSQGRIQYGRYAPVVHEMEASFAVTLTNFTLERLAVVGGQSRIVAQGLLEDFSSPAVQGAFDAQVSAGDLAGFLEHASLTAGVVHLSGSVTYQSRDNGSFLENCFLVGNLSSSVLKVRLPTGLTEVRDVRARYRLDRGNVEIHDIGAQALGGRLSASMTIHDVNGAARSTLKSHFQDVSVEQLQAIARQYWAREARLRGRISAATDVTWSGSSADLVIHSDVGLKGAVGQNPLMGVVHVDYAANEIEFRDSHIRTPETSISLHGKLGPHSHLQVTLRSSNLHEVDLLGANLRSTISGKQAQQLGVYGKVIFNGSVTGLVTAPHLEGKLEACNQSINGTSWKLLRASVDAAPSAFTLTNAYLEGATQGKLNLTLHAGLSDWVYTPSSPISLQISASQIALTDVARLAGQTYPVSGSLSGHASVRGSQLNPLGHGEISIADGKIFSEPIQSLNLKFQGDAQELHTRLVLGLPGGTAQAEVTVNPKTREYRACIQADDIRLEHLQVVKRGNPSIMGALSLKADGHGVISSPELTATLRISELQMHERMLPELTLEAKVHDRLAEITLNSEAEPTLLRGHGTVEIKPPYMADLHLDTARFSFEPLLALNAPTDSGAVRAETEVHASLRGALENTKNLEAHLTIPLLALSYRELQLGAGNPIRVDYRNGVLELKPVSVHGTGVDVKIHATLPVNNPDIADYLLEGTLDLRIAQLFLPELKCAGQIQLDLSSRKRIAGSDFDGELRIVNASLHSGALPLGLDNTNGILRIGRTKLEVKSFEGEIGGGTVTATGGVTLRPAIQFDLGLSGSNIRLRYPEGVRAILESNLTLIGNRKEATLGGTVEIQRLSLTPDFDLAELVNQFNQEEYSVPPSELARHVRLDINLESASQMDVVSTNVSFHGNANLRLEGTAAEPVVLGRANLNGGDLLLGGNRYVMQSGAIDFLNPLRTEPVVNIQAKTKIDQYVINLNVEGPIERMNTTFTSEPPLPPSDIINLIAFGKTSDRSGDNALFGTSLGAQSALVQGLGTAVSSRVQRFAGLSYFSINPALGGSNQNAGARVVIQHRISSNLVVTYSTDVTSTESQSIQMEYRLNPRWSVSGMRDQNGGFGATANFHKRF